MEMSVAVKHKWEKGLGVPELRLRPSNCGQEYLLHQSLHTTPGSWSRRQNPSWPPESTPPHKGGSWLQLSQAPTLREDCNSKALLEKDSGQRQPNTPRDTQKSSNCVDIPKRVRGRSIFLAAAFFDCLFLLPFWREKGGGWWQRDHVQDPEGSWHELLSGLLAQRPYYNTHIKVRGQALEGWFSTPAPTPNSLPTPCFERICVHTLCQNRFFTLPWSWNLCSLDGGSRCFYTSNSRGKNRTLTPGAFQIFCCLSSHSHELYFFF